jgi:hypothetical protein
MFPHVTEKELVSGKICCSIPHCEFTMDTPKTVMVFRTDTLFKLLEKISLQLVKFRDKFRVHCSPTLTLIP